MVPPTCYGPRPPAPHVRSPAAAARAGAYLEIDEAIGERKRHHKPNPIASGTRAADMWPRHRFQHRTNRSRARARIGRNGGQASRPPRRTRLSVSAKLHAFLHGRRSDPGRTCGWSVATADRRSGFRCGYSALCGASASASAMISLAAF